MKYFNLDLKASEILTFPVNIYRFKLRLRHLKRILLAHGFHRRNVDIDLDKVVRIMESELTRSSSLLGYRTMHQRLTNDHGLVVTRSMVRQILKNFRSWILEPNYIWHIDSYDKLKPFGFCIHSAIDGYSHCILWLEMTSTNKPVYHWLLFLRIS